MVAQITYLNNEMPRKFISHSILLDNHHWPIDFVQVVVWNHLIQHDKVML
jgi:hypothetical protein